MADNFSVVVAGHICLDIIPSLDLSGRAPFQDLFHPGHLIEVGPAYFSTGGPVSNTGLALYRLGVPARLMAKVGEDPFGQIIRSIVHRLDPLLLEGLVADPTSPTSYTVIINPPDTDRIFLHCPGANDTFGVEDVDVNRVLQSSLFHFGYPPIMRRMYQSGGEELAEIFRRVHAAGVTTSLDMAYPDPTTESGRADWRAILRVTLPNVDIFLPSFDELLFMLHRPMYDRLVHEAPGGSLLAQATPGLLSELSAEVLAMGVKMAVIKLGDRGLYLRTAGAGALCEMGRAAPVDGQAWANQELWAPCFQVNVVGTTGSGDATIAGFLSALLRGFTPRQAVTAAVAVGACNVEAADALSGIRSWEDTLARIQSGWPRRPLEITAAGWEWDERSGLWSHTGG